MLGRQAGRVCLSMPASASLRGRPEAGWYSRRRQSHPAMPASHCHARLMFHAPFLPFPPLHFPCFLPSVALPFQPFPPLFICRCVSVCRHDRWWQVVGEPFPCYRPCHVCRHGAGRQKEFLLHFCHRSCCVACSACLPCHAVKHACRHEKAGGMILCMMPLPLSLPLLEGMSLIFSHVTFVTVDCRMDDYRCIAELDRILIRDWFCHCHYSSICRH